MVSRLLHVAACALMLVPSLVLGQSEEGYSSNQRIQRIRQLAKTTPQAIPTLAEYLKDQNTDIRIDAVKAITKLGSEASLDPLIQGTKDNDSEVQIRSVDGLVNFYLPGYVAKGAISGSFARGMKQMKSLLSVRNDQVISSDITVRRDVADAIAGVVLHGSSIDSRSNAARAAGILHAGPTTPALLSGLRSRDSELIFECLVALQKIKDPATGPGVSFLARDLDDRIQSTALETIGMLRSLQAAPDVRYALQSARNNKIRRAAIQALAMLGIPGDRPIFKQYVADKDVVVRSAALEGLGRIREPEDTPILQAAYDEPEIDWRIHAAAAFGLVNEGRVDSGEFSPLAFLVENLNMKGRQDTAEAYLVELCRRGEVRQAVFPLVAGSSSQQKIAFCNILSESRSEDVVPVLNGLARDINPDVSLAASRGLRIVQARKL
jgi:HEAT repeat protein